MNREIRVEDFFSASVSKNLKDRDLLRMIISPLPGDSPVLYELTFQAAFAKRLFDIIKREGTHTQGFQRMQQSFLESVEKIKEILITYEKNSLISTSMLTAPMAEARMKLSRFVEDLALLKNWLISHNV
jgi:hypothetical protein